MPGWKPLIVCDGVQVPCTFASLIKLVEVVIFDLVLLSTLLAVGVFSYAGFLLLTSGGNPKAKDTAKEMIWKVMVGYMWILSAWLIVYTITSALLSDDYSTLLGAPRSN